MTSPSRLWVGAPVTRQTWYRLYRGSAYSVSGDPAPPSRRIGFRFDEADRRDEARPIQRAYEAFR